MDSDATVFRGRAGAISWLGLAVCMAGFSIWLAVTGRWSNLATWQIAGAGDGVVIVSFAGASSIPVPIPIALPPVFVG
jgi:hypothetical protein